MDSIGDVLKNSDDDFSAELRHVITDKDFTDLLKFDNNEIDIEKVTPRPYPDTLF